MTYADQGAAPIMEVLASEIAEERSRKAAIETKASATATSAAALGASIIALAGLLYSAQTQFQFTINREVALAVIVGLFFAALILSLIALYTGGYPNISGSDLRGFKKDHWTENALAGADAVFEKYATFLGTFGTKNDERVRILRIAIALQIGGAVATLLAGLLLAVKAI